MRHRFLAPLALVALAACGDRTSSPTGVTPRGPASVLNDGSRDGNKDFFFLPPLVPNPGQHPEFDAGAFNAGWSPTVRICRLESAENPVCTAAGTVATFSGAQVALDAAGELYQVNIDTRATWAAEGLYRAHVVIAPTAGSEVTLGFIDLVFLPSQSAVRNYQTDDVVPLLDGRTVPLKFRIENGASVSGTSPDYGEKVVTNDGGIVRTIDAATGEPGDAVIQFSPGWLGDEADEVVVTVSRVNVGTDNPCLTSVGSVIQTSDCWRVTTFPDIQVVHADVTIAFCPAIATTDARYDIQAMYKYDAGPPETLRTLPSAAEPEPLVCTPPPVIGSRDAGGAFGTLRRGAAWLAGGIGRLLGPSTAYALDAGLGGQLRAGDEAFSDFFWGVPLRVDPVGAATQAGVIGQPMTIDVLVTGAVEHEGDAPVPFAGITVTAGPVTGGTLAATTAVTNASGVASFNFTPSTATGSVTFGVNSVGANTTTSVGISATAAATALFSCTAAGTYGGDFIDRGFYVASYPGTTLQGADLRFSSTTAGTYQVQLTARAGGYGTAGTLLAQDTQTVVIPSGDVNSFVDASFRWPSVGVAQGTTVAFEMTLVSGPALPYYGTPNVDDANCPITQTNGTTPPLDTFRRQGIYGVIYGTAPVIP